jgi:hypothetical protein
MTFTFNGIGTALRGTRRITDSEFRRWKRYLPDIDAKYFYLTTESFVLFWVPVIPLQTFVLFYPERKWYQATRYVPCCFPAGEGRVDWQHVRRSPAFYIGPTILLIVLALIVFT